MLNKIICLSVCLSEGHMSYYRTNRGADILGNVIVLGQITFYLINKLLVNIHLILFIIDKMSSRAAFGPWAEVWRPLT